MIIDYGAGAGSGKSGTDYPVSQYPVVPIGSKVGGGASGFGGNNISGAMSGGFKSGRPDTVRYPDDFRKKSAGDQSLMSITIDEDDGDEDDDDDVGRNEITPLYRDSPDGGGSKSSSCGVGPSVLTSIAGRGTFSSVDRSAAFKRSNTDDSELERRMARIFHEIKYSLTDSLEEPKGCQSSLEGGVHGLGHAVTVTRAEAETQTMSDQEMFESLMIASPDGRARGGRGESNGGESGTSMSGGTSSATPVDVSDVVRKQRNDDVIMDNINYCEQSDENCLSSSREYD